MRHHAGVTTSIAVFDDGDNVFIRCDACGLVCPIPPGMVPSPVHDFVRQHRLETDPALHPAECPAWGMAASSR